MIFGEMFNTNSEMSAGKIADWYFTAVQYLGTIRLLLPLFFSPKTYNINTAISIFVF